MRKNYLASDFTSERRSAATLGLGLIVRLLVHLDWLRVVVTLIALDLLAHDGDVLVNLGRDTVDSGGLGERDTGTVCCQVRGAAWRTLEPAAGDLYKLLAGVWDVLAGRDIPSLAPSISRDHVSLELG